MQAVDHISIQALNLSNRTRHTLSRSGIKTVGQLKQLDLKKEQFKIRLIGEKSFAEISRALSRCSEYLSYCVGLGLSLMGKETQSGGTFQTDIPCLQLVT